MLICEACKKRIVPEADAIKHHTSYKNNTIVKIHPSCHNLIHTRKKYQHLLPEDHRPKPNRSKHVNSIERDFIALDQAVHKLKIENEKLKTDVSRISRERDEWKEYVIILTDPNSSPNSRIPNSRLPQMFDRTTIGGMFG